MQSVWLASAILDRCQIGCVYFRGRRPGFFNQSPWLERTTIAADKFLTSLGYLEGEPTMEVPTGQKLKALQAEHDKTGAKRKLVREIQSENQ